MTEPRQASGAVQIERVSETAFSITVEGVPIAEGRSPLLGSMTTFYHTDEARQIFDQLKEHFG